MEHDSTSKYAAMSSVEIDLTGDDEVPMLKMAKTTSNSTTTLGRMMSSGGMHSGGMGKNQHSA